MRIDEEGSFATVFKKKKIPANVMLTLCIGLVWVLFSIIFEKNADSKLVTRETADSLCDIWYYNSFFKALNSSLN